MWRVPVYTVQKLSWQQEISSQRLHGRIQRVTLHVLRRQWTRSVPNLFCWSQLYWLLACAAALLLGYAVGVLVLCLEKLHIYCWHVSLHSTTSFAKEQHITPQWRLCRSFKVVTMNSFVKWLHKRRFQWLVLCINIFWTLGGQRQFNKIAKIVQFFQKKIFLNLL